MQNTYESLNNALLSVNKKDIEIYSNEFQDLIIDRNDNIGKIGLLIAKLKRVRIWEDKEKPKERWYIDKRSGMKGRKKEVKEKINNDEEPELDKELKRKWTDYMNHYYL